MKKTYIVTIEERIQEPELKSGNNEPRIHQQGTLLVFAETRCQYQERNSEQTIIDNTNKLHSIIGFIILWINRIGTVLYSAAMLIGIITQNPSLILLASIYSFFYGLLTFSWFGNIFGNSYQKILGTSIMNKEFAMLISLLFALCLWLLSTYYLYKIPAPCQILELSNFGNLLMGISIVFILIDALFKQK